MKRWILFVCSAALLYYVALLYRSTSLLFCVYAVLLSEAGFFLHLAAVSRKLRVDIMAPAAVTEEGGAIPLELRIANSGRFPAGQVRVRIRITYLMNGKRQHIQMRSVVSGRHRGQNLSVTRLRFDVAAQYPGRVRISVRRAWVFDLPGILCLPLRRKRMNGQAIVLVLPERQEIPLELDERIRQTADGGETEQDTACAEHLPEMGWVREYIPGDALRNIHWKLTAKQDKLMVREWLTEQSCPVLFFLDLRRVSDRFLQCFYSLGMELLRQNYPYYLVYYERDTGDLVRTPVTQEEDLYAYCLQTDLLDGESSQRKKRQKWQGRPERTAGEEIHTTDWERDYVEKYHPSDVMDSLALWQDLVCTYHGEVIWKAEKVK